MDQNRSRVHVLGGAISLAVALIHLILMAPKAVGQQADLRIEIQESVQSPRIAVPNLSGPISIADAHDLYAMRLLLEKSCVRCACDEASNKDLISLNEFRFVEKLDLVHWVRYNRNFHSRIAELSGNARMTKMTKEVITQFDRLTFVGVSNAPSLVTSEKFVAEHGSIIDALQARDRGKAVGLINKHITRAKKRLFAVLENPQIVE